ncbi:hypothetical protein NDR87_09775 [Nocardia sp. CDC159]|uniref:Uncharacterized protein n=1 Tax=Nocardia pulmonis TaxID=2951408 RepID=A0A9X2E3S3_9NOCA|nr:MULTISPECIES: hypothetical protein [Nocardia]MCM6773757.1 hypothetical protein [Nocardia pulmonis]MCM6786644.1 hypothetical protein [Nocardia sp. CDC159]
MKNVVAVAVSVLALGVLAGCGNEGGGGVAADRTVVTISGSAATGSARPSTAAPETATGSQVAPQPPAPPAQPGPPAPPATKAPQQPPPAPGAVDSGDIQMREANARDYQRDSRRYFFQSPWGSVMCGYTVTDAIMGCQLIRVKVASPGLPDCRNTGHIAAEIDKFDASRFTCLPLPHYVVDPHGGSPALPYGQYLDVANVVCESRSAGIRCTAGNSGHGFMVGPDGQSLF